MWKTLWIMWKTIRNPPKIKDLRKPKHPKFPAKKIPKRANLHDFEKAAKPYVPRVIPPKTVKKGNKKTKLYTRNTGYAE